MKNYIGYCRVSTKYQEKSGLGLLAQQDSINHFIKLRNGNLVKEFSEVESGKVNNRPKLIEAMEACRLYDATLLIANLDRLSRDASFLLSLQKGDVPFIAVDMPDANNFTIGIMALLAQQEREMISKRTKEALAILKAKGKKLGGKRENSHKITKEDIEKGRLIRVEKYKLYKDRITPTLKELKDNGLTLKEICKTLEERKIKTFRKKNIWTRDALRNLLKA